MKNYVYIPQSILFEKPILLDGRLDSYCHSSAGNIVVIFDEASKIENQMSSVVKTSFYQLSQLPFTRP